MTNNPSLQTRGRQSPRLFPFLNDKCSCRHFAQCIENHVVAQTESQHDVQLGAGFGQELCLSGGITDGALAIFHQFGCRHLAVFTVHSRHLESGLCKLQFQCLGLAGERGAMGDANGLQVGTTGILQQLLHTALSHPADGFSMRHYTEILRGV